MKKQSLINRINLVLGQAVYQCQHTLTRPWHTMQLYIQKNKYLRLMRLHQPTGYLLMMLPCLWMIGFAARGLLHIIELSVFFACGAIVIRSAGCIINDIVDHKLDQKVERTKSRPLASGEVSLMQAIILLGGLLSIALLMLLSLPKSAIYLGIFMIIPIIIYPFLKRYTHFPQVFLGFVFNIGVILAWITISGSASFHPILVYFASALWTIGYDTIYAMQDREDDINAGIKSLAIQSGEHSITLIKSLYQLSILCLFIEGLGIYMNWGFFIIMCLAGYHLYWQIETLDVNDTKNAKQKFDANVLYGALVLIAIWIGRIKF